MSELDDRLRRLAERGEVRGAASVFDEARDAPPTGQGIRSTRVLVLAAVALITVVAVGAGLVVRDDTPRSITSDVPDVVDGVLPFNTDTVLVFDDGTTGIVAVDLDGRRVLRQPLEGNRGGDQPFRFLRTGDDVVYGWGDVYTSKLDGSAARLVGGSTIFVPALDEGTVWLVDYPGGSIGAGTPTLRHVDLDGTVLESDTGMAEAQTFPLREVVGGMAYETPDGIVVWNPETQETTEPLPGARTIGDVHDSLVAWCAEAPCGTVHISDLDAGTDVTTDVAESGLSFDIAAATFSPTGDALAVPSGRDLVVIDPETGEMTAEVGAVLPETARLAWADDGHRLFFAATSYGASMGLIGLHDLDTGETTRRSVPFGGTLGFVALPDTIGYRLFDTDAERFEPCDADVDACPTTTTTTTAVPATTTSVDESPPTS